MNRPGETGAGGARATGAIRTRAAGPGLLRSLPFALVLAALAACGIAREAAAWFEPTPVQTLVLASRSPADLRARLLAHADSLAASAPLEAGEACYAIGVSLARAGERDSAIATFRRARSLRGGTDECSALAASLLDRGAPGDADSALALLAGPLRALAGDPRPLGARLRLMTAWAHVRTGDPSVARPSWLPPRGDLVNPRLDLPDRPYWLARFAPLAVQAGDTFAAWPMLASLVTLSRGADPRSLAVARATGPGHFSEPTFEEFLAAAIAHADSLEAAPFAPLGARPMVVRAEDGFTLRGGWCPSRPRSPLALLLPPAEGAGLASFDSVAAQLHAQGYVVAWLDPRGSRRSAGPGCALPEAWRGREEAFERRWARDAAAAITAVARISDADARRVVIVGEGASALPATLAAAADPRVHALVIADAAPAPAERGWLRETLAQSRVPVFFQTGPENIPGNDAVDQLVALLPPAQARVADSQRPGGGAALFRAGPATAKRLSDWLAGAMRTPRATPPSQRP